MSEYVRSISVHIEIDTNKQTHVLELNDTAAFYIQHKIDKFFEEHAAGKAVGP